jgi:hypothetical protein
MDNSRDGKIKKKLKTPKWIKQARRRALREFRKLNTEGKI